MKGLKGLLVLLVTIIISLISFSLKANVISLNCQVDKNCNDFYSFKKELKINFTPQKIHIQITNNKLLIIFNTLKVKVDIIHSRVAGEEIEVGSRDRFVILDRNSKGRYDGYIYINGVKLFISNCH